MCAKHANSILVLILPAFKSYLSSLVNKHDYDVFGVLGNLKNSNTTISFVAWYSELLEAVKAVTFPLHNQKVRTIKKTMNDGKQSFLTHFMQLDSFKTR